MNFLWDILILSSPVCLRTRFSDMKGRWYRYDWEEVKLYRLWFELDSWDIFKEGNGTPLQYSCLENPWTEEPGGLQSMGLRLSDFTFTFHFHVLEKEMATHSGVLAWRIPGTVESGGLPSMGLHRVGHYWSDLAVSKQRWVFNNNRKTQQI